MIKTNVAEFKSRLSHFLRLAKGGEKVVVCERNRPVVELVAIPPAIDVERRRAAFGLFDGLISKGVLDAALAPMSDVEAEAFLEGTT